MKTTWYCVEYYDTQTDQWIRIGADFATRAAAEEWVLAEDMVELARLRVVKRKA